MNKMDIKQLKAREILDSRGRPTVEASIELADGTQATASIPSGASVGSHEAKELRDGEEHRHRGLGVLRAIVNIRREIAPALIGFSVEDQDALDSQLIELDGTPNKSRLGANAILAVSLVAARVGAAASKMPLWKWMRRWRSVAGPPLLPMPMINILSGGLHATNNLDLQDFLILPIGARSMRQAIEMSLAVRWSVRDILLEKKLSVLLADEGGFSPSLENHEAALSLLVQAIERAGMQPGIDIALGLDVAATHFYDAARSRYELAHENGDMDAGGIINLLRGWMDRYPIISIEDALAEDDWGNWCRLTQELGGRAQIIGDDLFTTNPERLRRGIASRAANAVLVKMNQIGTLTETMEVVDLAHAAGLRTVISARSGETEDSALADLAVGSSGGQIKVGSLTCSERQTKYNRLLEIADDLDEQAQFNWAPFQPVEPSGSTADQERSI